MTKAMRYRRRAERFAQLLDEASGGRRQHLRTSLDEELGELVALRHELVSTRPDPELDPEFRTGLRAMLVATAEREGIGATAQPESPEPAPRGRRFAFPTPARAPRARTAVVAGVAVGAVAFTGMSSASENAVPGDTLYGVKRSTERAQLALASSDVGRGQLYLDFAQTRLGEAQTVSSDLGRVLDDMDRDTSQGVRLLTTAAANRHDRTALDAIDAFTRTQREALETLAGRVNVGEADRVAGSLELLDLVEERTSDLRRSLDLECGSPSAASVDALGPVPNACVSLPAPSALDLGEEGLTEEPGQQPSSSSQSRPVDPGQSQPGGADEARSSDPGGAEPDQSPGSSDQTDERSGSLLPGGEEPEEPADEDEQSAEDDGGLLSGINRLLGDLLGS